MDNEERLRRMCRMSSRELSLADTAWAQCSARAPGISALVFGTVDGIADQGEKLLRGSYPMPVLELVGAAGLGVALSAAPRSIALPAAVIGGAGTISAAADAQRAVSRSLAATTERDVQPNLARKTVACEIGPVAAELASMLTLGLISPRLSNAVGRSKVNHRWWHSLRHRSELEIGQDKYLSDFRSYKLPHVDLRYFAPTEGARSRLHLFDSSKIKRVGFGDNAILKFSPYTQLTDDEAKHVLVKQFQSRSKLDPAPDGLLRLPLLPRQYANVACGFRSKSHFDSKMYEHAKDSVVQVHASGRGDQTWSGSGFLVSKDGKIATALHVVADASKLKITAHNGTKYDAALVAHDFDADLAVLKVQGEGPLFKALPLANANQRIKNDVFLFGYPAGSQTMFMSPALFHRVGFERAYLSPSGNNKILYQGRVFETRAYFVHDRTGNSGGPVLNSDGEVIAVHTDADLHSRNTYDEVRVGVGAASGELSRLLNSVREQPNLSHEVWKPHLLFPRSNSGDHANRRWWSFLLP